ncbi:hypothetical protein BD769DRAFT_1391501 [Suillus cothurnatus]|nr:hypothetical protein BD769DRAFT_1391501 [Suillus cothurnatus]
MDGHGTQTNATCFHRVTCWHCPKLQTHTSNTLQFLENALAVFHANKDILHKLEVCEHFNIPKIHQLSHYVQSISLYGTTDGFNTKLPEHLHINFTKEAYWARSRIKRNKWLCGFNARKPCLDSEMEDLQFESHAAPTKAPPVIGQCVLHVLANTPAHPQTSIQQLITTHGTVSFLPALKLFLHKHMPKNHIVPGPQDCFDIFWKVVIVAPPDPWVVSPGPGRKPGSPAKFDMVLINNGAWTTNLQTLDGTQVAQVHVIFTLPCQFGMYSRALAYIEWFTPFREPDPFSGLLQYSHHFGFFLMQAKMAPKGLVTAGPYQES